MRSKKTTTGVKAFVRPGWIITILLVVAFSYSAFMILSPWQLNKDAQIVERNEHIENAFKDNPKSYSEVFDAQGKIRGNQEWMRIQLTGHYLADQEVILRLRPVESTPAYHALTPFKLSSGEIIVINRGFEPSVAGQELHMPAAPQEEVTLIAHARVNEPTPQTAPMTTTQPVQVYGINTEQIASLTQLDLSTDYAQLAQDQPGQVNYIPIPKLDRGNHLSYGFQWIAFGIMAPLGLGYMIYSESKERRRAREEEEQMAAHVESGAGPDPEPELKMRSRYGNQHKNYFTKGS
ncbi:SURF1 family cytochrome oxidase biogenesis protein [Corynebacterium felinum]|uniref:SURF1-like protein n=1 Tax=Corynebacterium felinum TaxID=131318 RepID=A0ABU2BE81_9CORY|nr:SURF1 family cytochrome oxidase biogenesis protein [Corynebacterium felinum]MDF5821203.1 SURF1 family cytochrome oxidase biogenesis protein [Corynebacterium felinum]MDR7356279.1 cytochrome oxidase assembly protein ShyY1 [Corynebacterium felinum]WJY95612.1 SURF1 family protein [Corynebacterium felinum]